MRRARRLRRGTAAVVAVVGSLVVAACAQGGGPTYTVDQPSFHSAGPQAEEEIQTVLDSQARTIGRGDWSALLAMYIPTERSRCPPDRFAEAADESYGELRNRAEGMRISATMSNLEVTGFRASADYQFVIAAQGLASPAQTAHYLKLGDRWFIDDKAC